MNLEIIKPGQTEYEAWNNRGVNLRYKGQPSGIIPVATIQQLTNALQYAVSNGSRVAIRGGGHCLENFVSNPDVDLIIDISRMKGVRHDDSMNAIEVSAGTTLGEMQEILYNNWGTTLPTGEHPAVGIGGHIQGGAFGFLCRQHGLGVDYLYAVEVLCVDQDMHVEKIIATRNAADENRELWWAHTGGGAGNFGVVTSFWFRMNDTNSLHPSDLLPKAPNVIETIELEWKWTDFNEISFRQLVDNYCDWVLRNSAPGMKSCKLYATLHLWNKMMEKIQLKGLVTEPADDVVNNFLQSLQRNIEVPFSIIRKKLSWLDFALHPFPDIFSGPKAAFKVKDAFLKRPFTHQQINTIYHYLTEHQIPGGNVGLATYGGQVNTVAKDSTASAQRGAILDMACAVGWLNPEEEAKALEWVRNCYSELFQETGGVPIHGEQTGGAIIAHPDNDLADASWNKSGVPWRTLYYHDNYPRLQKIKASWDPHNIFRHDLSVELP